MPVGQTRGKAPAQDESGTGLPYPGRGQRANRKQQDNTLPGKPKRRHPLRSFRFKALSTHDEMPNAEDSRHQPHDATLPAESTSTSARTYTSNCSEIHNNERSDRSSTTELQPPEPSLCMQIQDQSSRDERDRRLSTDDSRHFLPTEARAMMSFGSLSSKSRGVGAREGHEGRALDGSVRAAQCRLGRVRQLRGRGPASRPHHPADLPHSNFPPSAGVTLS